MDTKTTRKRIRQFFLLAVVILAISIVPFVLNFWNTGISTRLSDWAMFGDYFSGVVNTAVSIISVVILGYITILIPRIDSEENQKLFLKQKQIEAYDSFAVFIPKIQLVPNRTIRKMKVLRNVVKAFGSTDFQNSIMDLSNSVEEFRDFYEFILNFKLRYSHIFQYDFESEDFKRIISTSKILLDSLDERIDAISALNADYQPTELDKKLMVDYFNSIGIVCDALKSEINN